MGLSNVQEQAIKQQEQIQQRTIDNQNTIHYTIQNATKQLRTTDGFTPATNLTPLSLEMLVSEKKDNAITNLNHFVTKTPTKISNRWPSQFLQYNRGDKKQ